jgi:DNA helicase-2/ATP-dependent DNA helicase PcrA
MTAARLNAAQRAAVEHGEGPLLIVAGAGTGKTRVIVERVGHLLRNVAALQPEQILALTFSNKAAEEMRRRAGEQFGAQGSRCRFSTFHSFCYELLAASGPSRTLDPVDQWIFLRRHLGELELEHYFKVSEPGRFLADLVDFCSRCHDNLVTPAEYYRYVEERAADGAGKSGSASGCDEQEIARQREVAHVFTLLERMLEKQDLLTFGSMISQAVRLLDASPELLERLQRRYPYVLVDEFQDTNTAQFELLARLAGKRRNLTVVGDDDQAIYRFRGASYASFQQFAERYPEHVRIVLDRNYRSTKHILAVAGTAIAANSLDRYMPDKKLISEQEAGPSVELWEFPDDVSQAEYIAEQIGEIAGRNPASRYADLAVLYRAHAHRDRLVEALRRRGIPFEIRMLAINDLPVVRDLVAALRMIGVLSDSVSLVRVLADPRWKTPPELLRRFCREADKQRRSLWEALGHMESSGGWERREAFLDFRSRYAALAAKERLLAWFPLLCAELGIPRTPRDRPAVETFTRFLSRWEREKSETGRLEEFLEYFGYFEEAGGVIALGEEDPFPASPAGGAQGELALEPPKEEGRGAVQLMTVHGAKGLEFERVFVLQLVRRAFPTYHRRPLIELPAALWKGPLPRGDFHIEEERRLFYVALTRAQRSLVLSTISNPKQRPSIFVEQLQEIPPPQLLRRRPVYTPGASMSDAEEDRTAATESAGRRLADWFAQPAPPPKEDFALSISQLETYLECPLKYHLRQHWRVPVPAPPALLFGATVHGAIKEVLAGQAAGKTPPEKIQEILDRHWPAAGFPDKVQEEKYRELGWQQLTGVAKAWRERGIVLLYQEMRFEMRGGGCRLVGRLDQFHRAPGGGVELVEYKTGRPRTQKEVDRDRQLTLYAEACDRVLGVTPASLILYNVTNQEEVRTQRSEQDYRELERTIRETARKILAGSFPAQPGYHCRYCAFRAVCPAQEDASRER